MSVLLISAGRSSFKGALWGGYDFDLPLNVAYAAAYLEKNGHETTGVDFQFPETRPGDFLKISDFLPFDFVGISAILSSCVEAYGLATGLRKKGYTGTVFIFGPLGLYLKNQILDDCPGVDAVVWGEEEPTILDLVENDTHRNSVRGISHRENGSAVETLPRGYIEDLDSLPFPARDKFDVLRYFPSPGKYYRLPQITMLSSRGCDYRCLFCEKTGGMRLRSRSAENIAAEIDRVIIDHGAREISFIDEMFGSNRTETLKLAELISRRNHRIHLRISTRIDHVDREVLTELKRAGLYSVGFGIESGSDAVLRFNKKQITTAHVREKVSMIRSLGLEIRGYFMINMPAETRERLEQTRRFIEELELDLVNVQIAYPFPNTPFRRLVERNYRPVKEKWNRWELSDGDDVVFTQSDLTAVHLKNQYRDIIRTRYLNLRFIIGWLKRIRTCHDFKYAFLQFVNLVRT
jgi:radical SAM superfamily enzyme YgiQ (UPF0313 family)